VTLDPEGDVELVARPAAPARGIGARTVIVREGAARPWHPPLEISDEGAVRIAGRTKALFPATEGLYDLVVVVGKEASLPNEDEAVRIATGTLSEGPRFRVLRARVRFVEKK
jgi:hypothetical protein